MDCRTTMENLHHFVTTPLSIFFNSFTLYIISSKSKDELSSYRTVLIIMCVSDLLSTTCYFVVDLVSCWSFQRLFVAAYPKLLFPAWFLVGHFAEFGGAHTLIPVKAHNTFRTLSNKFQLKYHSL